MAVYVKSARDMVTDYLSFIDNVTYATSSAGQKTAALAAVNNGYRRVLAGDYVNSSGDAVTHVWSFAKKAGTITLKAGDYDYLLPDDYEGDVDEYVYDYDSDAYGLDIEVIGSESMRVLRRDDNEEGNPRRCTVQAVAYAASTGGTFEWLSHPKPLSATITQATTVITRVTGPGFHSGLVGEDIEITGETNGTVQSVTSTDALVVDTNQTIATATEATYSTGLTISYRYRAAFADFTDSATVYPPGLTGIGDLIVQAARANEEHDTSGQDGSETARYYRYMSAMVARDKKMIPGRTLQQTVDVGSKNRRYGVKENWRSLT